jgi:hypothetical protein
MKNYNNYANGNGKQILLNKCTFHTNYLFSYTIGSLDESKIPFFKLAFSLFLEVFHDLRLLASVCFMASGTNFTAASNNAGEVYFSSVENASISQ